MQLFNAFEGFWEGCRKGCNILSVNWIRVAWLVNALIINTKAKRWKENVKKSEKKVQKNLEDKKKSVSLQPVWEITASSLTSLRKDNEVKLEEEIKLVCNKKNDRESIVMLWTAISRQRVNENKCKFTLIKVLVIHFKEIHTERRLQERTADA